MEKFLAIVWRAITWRRKLKEGREEDYIPRPETTEEAALGIPWDGPLTPSDNDLRLSQPSTEALEQGQRGTGSRQGHRHNHPNTALTPHHWKKRSCYRCRKPGHLVKACPEPRKIRKEGHRDVALGEADDEHDNPHKSEPRLPQPSNDAGRDRELELHHSSNSDDFALEETQPYPVPPADYWSSEETEESLGTSTVESIEQKRFPHFEHFTDAPGGESLAEGTGKPAQRNLDKPKTSKDPTISMGATITGYRKGTTLYVEGYVVAGKKAIAVRPLIDSGADANLIHPDLVERWGLPTRPLPRKVRSTTIDGTPNRGGPITHRVEGSIRLEGYDIPTNFYVSDIGDLEVVCYRGVHPDNAAEAWSGVQRRVEEERR
ncbi:hypothetical protein AcW1_003399 [Taiwanofungus camphoratus]|nr:hypothetical protein AcW1_003399 [Antrodia cinnamomea]